MSNSRICPSVSACFAFEQVPEACADISSSCLGLPPFVMSLPWRQHGLFCVSVSVSTSCLVVCLGHHQVQLLCFGSLLVSPLIPNCVCDALESRLMLMLLSVRFRVLFCFDPQLFFRVSEWITLVLCLFSELCHGLCHSVTDGLSLFNLMLS